MPIPTITMLQFRILCMISKQNDVSGREVRGMLAYDGHHQSGPAFYQCMARLEDAGLVEGWYVTKEIEGQTVRERTYKATPDGLKAKREFQTYVSVQ